MPHSAPNRTMLRRALFLLTVCGIVAFSVLICQLFRLQILRHDQLESAALRQQLRRTELPAGRGAIYDRNGTVLAMSATTYTVYLSPAEIAWLRETWYARRGTPGEWEMACDLIGRPHTMADAVRAALLEAAG